MFRNHQHLLQNHLLHSAEDYQQLNPPRAHKQPFLNHRSQSSIDNITVRPDKSRELWVNQLTDEQWNALSALRTAHKAPDTPPQRTLNTSANAAVNASGEHHTDQRTRPRPDGDSRPPPTPWSTPPHKQHLSSSGPASAPSVQATTPHPLSVPHDHRTAGGLRLRERVSPGYGASHSHSAGPEGSMHRTRPADAAHDNQPATPTHWACLATIVLPADSARTSV